MSDDKVVGLKLVDVGENYQVNPDSVLTEALGQVKDVIVIGVDLNGELYLASSHSPAEVNMLLDVAKRHLVGEAAKYLGLE